MRVTHALLGLVAGALWLVLPRMTIKSDGPVPAMGAATASARGGAPATDLVLPVAVVVVVVALAGYGYLRRTRRARTRTTPGTVPAVSPVPTDHDFERRARDALVAADDSVRTSREELGFAEASSGATAVEPYTRAVLAAQAELDAAFAIRRRYERGAPLDDEAARRQVLAGIIGRCAEAGRRLDTESAEFDRLRGLETGLGGALEVAERRFRELTGRTAAAETLLADLAGRYASSATASVTGYVEQAKDRLVFATTHLNHARQSVDSGDGERAARELRAAEGAVAQADVLISGVERLAGELRDAAALVPATLTGGEAEIAAARGRTAPSMPEGEQLARAARADAALAAVREEMTRGPYDPLHGLRRITRTVGPLGVGRAGVIPAAARLTAHSAASAAADYVSTHRGAVGAEARTRLAAAERLLTERPDQYVTADALAHEARALAERDVRAHGNPYAGADDATGRAGAVLGGVLLNEEPDAGPPASYGGPETRGRRRLLTK